MGISDRFVQIKNVIIYNRLIMLVDQILLKEGLGNQHVYILSHVGILKFFAFWGLLEALLFYLTKGDKSKEIIIHAGIIIFVTLFVYVYPHLSEYI